MTVEQSVDAGTKIIIRVALAALGLYFVYLISDVVLLIFLSVLTAAALTPAIRRVRRVFRVGRAPAVVITYGLLLVGLITFLAFFVPVFLDEIRRFFAAWPLYAERLNASLSTLENMLKPLGLNFDREASLQNLESNISQGVSGVFSITADFFSSLVSLIGFFFLAFYLSLEEKGIEKLFLLITPERYHSYALSIAERMQGKVSQWLFAQAILMLVIFVIYYIGLSLLGVPYALALALFGGLLEIVPYLGPIIAAIPALIVAFFVSPVMGFSVLAFYLVVQQIEGNVITPQVIKKSVGLSPVVLIIAVLVGAKLAGGVGILLTIAAVMILSVFVEDFLHKKTIENENAA